MECVKPNKYHFLKRRGKWTSYERRTWEDRNEKALNIFRSTTNCTIRVKNTGIEPYLDSVIVTLLDRSGVSDVLSVV